MFGFKYFNIMKPTNFYLKMVCKLKEKSPLFFSSGFMIACAGVLLYFVFPILMNNEIRKRLVLKEGSESFKNWKDIPVPIYLHFYFFNITNTADILNLTRKPILQQLGPYTFREEREKIVLSINENDTITYKQVRRWYYEHDMTNGSLDDTVYTLNIPMVAAAAKAKDLNNLMVYFTMEQIFDNYGSSWFVQKPVRELLFEGYDDPLMELAQKFIGIPFDKFGWFYKKNGTDDGIVNIFSGQNNIQNVDKIYTWNGKNTSSAFLPPCNMINGTAGDIWPPQLSKDSTLTMFVPDMCRSISFTYLSEVTLNEIRAYRYWSDASQLDNGKYDMRNRCFCGDGMCLPSGAINVSLCKYEAPVAVSYPHFLHADPLYNEGVIGLNPDPEKHRMFMDVIPEMGITVRVAARLQINVVFEAIPEIRQFQNITERIYFPVFWFSETAEAGEDITSQIKLVIDIIPTISKCSAFLFVLIGIILMVISLTLFIQYRRMNKPGYLAVAS